MKKVVFGASLILCATIGVSVLLIIAQQAFQTLGTLSGSTNVRTYWDYLGLMSYFHVFIVMGVIGVVVCVIECLLEIFHKRSK